MQNTQLFTKYAAKADQLFSHSINRALVSTGVIALLWSVLVGESIAIPDVDWLRSKWSAVFAYGLVCGTACLVWALVEQLKRVSAYNKVMDEYPNLINVPLTAVSGAYITNEVEMLTFAGCFIAAFCAAMAEKRRQTRN